MSKVFNIIGAKSSNWREPDDFYATDPYAVKELLKVQSFDNNVWECACGKGHISKVLKRKGYNVYSTDIVDRGYGEVLDFLSCDGEFDGDILTNPPYKYALEFIKKALELIPKGNKVCMFLKVNFLEGQERYSELYRKNPPKYVYVFTNRVECAKDGGFTGSSAICYCWYVWEKGFVGEPTLRWIGGKATKNYAIKKEKDVPKGQTNIFDFIDA